MISDGNILRLLYFLFFILSSWSSIPRPSFNHTSANFENKNKWNFLDDPAASQIARERIIFPSPVSQIYSEGSKVTTPFLFLVFYFAWAIVSHLAYISCCSTHFPQYFLVGGKGGGRATHFLVFYFV